MLLAVVIAVLSVNCSWAQEPPPFRPKGTVIKYSQPIRHEIDPLWPSDMLNWGEDIPSDVDWNRIMTTVLPPLEPNWIIADDFRDEFKTPVRTVRWWGSYVGPTFQQVPGGVIPLTGPGSEDGYAISFFADVPVGPNNPFSHPDGLLGSYLLPLDKVSIKPTPYVGWDMHPIWEYEANLMDAHLDHPSPLADPMGFNQRPGEVYWISIAAEVGHKITLIPDPAGGDPIWVSEDTGKFANSHYWGWHTSPVHFNDIATMGHLVMPGNEWQYFGWMPIQPHHYLYDMAFQLKTVPEPTGIVLVMVALVAAYGCRGKRF
jgi:hypothetical protein